jgi:hypothetical protein
MSTGVTKPTPLCSLHRVVGLHIALDQPPASSGVSGVQGRTHSLFSDLCQRFPFDCG